MEYFVAFLSGIAISAYALLFWNACKASWNEDWTGAVACVLSLLILL
jgi:hypothetical protein